MSECKPDERELVAKGATFMDKIVPGWHKRINLNRLNMSSGSSCLLGQTFGIQNERRLVEEMYPEEFKASVEAIKEAGDDGTSGYQIASGHAHYQGAMINRIMDKLGLASDPVSQDELQALTHVCWGHDNKCLWADEITDRLAKDKEAEDAQGT